MVAIIFLKILFFRYVNAEVQLKVTPCLLSLSLVDEDSNGKIDYEELKKCIQKLQLHFSDAEIHDLFHSCDLDESKVIEFNEFIVLLCLIYLLMEPSSSHTVFTINLILIFPFLFQL